MMTENKQTKMNLEHERKIANLQERVDKLENLCYAAKEILNLEEAADFLGMAKSTLYKMTHLNQLPYFKPAGKLIFFEKKANRKYKFDSLCSPFHHNFCFLISCSNATL